MIRSLGYDLPVPASIQVLIDRATAEATKWKGEAANLQTRVSTLQAEATRLRAEAEDVARRAGGLLGLKDIGSMVEWIEIRSAYGPTIKIEGPLKASAPTPPGPGASVLKALKPLVAIKIKEVAQPVVVAPYGQPGPTAWPTLTMGSGALIGGLVGGLFRGKIGAVGGALVGAALLGQK
jgi:hypothetical protein